MKSIYLIRHSEPQRLLNVSQEEWPLSEYGHESAEAFFHQRDFREVAHVYTSPFRRALETVRHADLPITVDLRLQERRTGETIPALGDCWLRQYEDDTFKCPDGESFAEVGKRMESCINDILVELEDGRAAIVVSHAAAICAYLKRYCTIRVVDRVTKTREIMWYGRQIYLGSFPTLMCFHLTFGQGKLMNVEALQ